MQRVQDHVDAALATVHAIEAADAIASGTTVIDLREPEERFEQGLVPDAVHVPRGVLELAADPGHARHHPVFDGRSLLLLCDDGTRAVLGAMTLWNMSYTDVRPIAGGFEAWVRAGGPVDRPARQEGGVTGIGGVFFKARDNKALAAWYREHLGIPVDPAWNGCAFPWRDEAGRPGTTTWSVFAADSEYFGAADQQFMVNYRTPDLDGLVAALAERGVGQVGEMQDGPYGKFAWVEDGEGHRIELWQPPHGT